jgi:methylisocitrate lyase
MPIDAAAKRAEFRRLHESGCFVIPNPWDVGTAKYLQHLGFRALASTSSGFAWSVGHADNAVGCDDVLEHLAAIAGAVEVPVNADFEGGYADMPEGVAANVKRAVATGISGLSIEDSTGNKDAPLRDIAEGVRRMAAARSAIDATGTGVLLTGRAEISSSGGRIWLTRSPGCRPMPRRGRIVSMRRGCGRWTTSPRW